MEKLHVYSYTDRNLPHWPSLNFPPPREVAIVFNLPCCASEKTCTVLDPQSASFGCQ